MKQKTITYYDLIKFPSFVNCLEIGAIRLLGCMWKQYYEIIDDSKELRIIINYD